TPPAPAHAATGRLVINFSIEFTDPEGCYQTDDESTTYLVANQTDQTAYLFSEPDCQGYQVTAVRPGQTRADIYLGHSLYIR
ncbi:hypothetical protein C1I98_39205, partial [Spongiactinospora gelatinilytica]